MALDKATNKIAQKQPDAKTPEFLVIYRTETANTHQWCSKSEQQLSLRWEGGSKWDFWLGWYVLDLDLGPVWHFHHYVHDKIISCTYVILHLNSNTEKKGEGIPKNILKKWLGKIGFTSSEMLIFNHTLQIKKIKTWVNLFVEFYHASWTWCQGEKLIQQSR